MGSTTAITMEANCTDDPKSGKICLKTTYSLADAWGGVVWQHPHNDWGEQPGGANLTGAKKLTFWARGAAGGETIKFGFGLLGKDKKFFDTGKGEKEITLEKTWKQYTLDVSDQDMKRIKTGFFWSLAGQGKPLTFYLDRIAFE